jgi:two-component system sensor histidine kinase KdpD
LWLAFQGYAAALGAVIVVSLVIAYIVGPARLANVSILYLFAVLASAAAFGRGPAVFASVVAFLIFDWFFVAPLHQFTIADPAEWVELLLFMLTATVTGQLAAGQRQRRREAEQREREAVVLYDIVRLMSESPLESALEAVAERLRSELQLPALAVEFWRPSGELVRIATGDNTALQRGAAPSRVLQTGPSASSDCHAAPGRWARIVRGSRAAGGDSRSVPAGNVDVVPIKAGDRRIGGLTLFRREPGFAAVDNRLVSAAATQIGIAVDRDRLRQEAMEAEILRRTDQLRAALLNAVSHDLRTPLAAIIASAGSLRQQDIPWSEADRQTFTEAIEQEAERLNRLVNNLLDLSRIEAGSLRPDKSWNDLGAVVDDVVERLQPLTAHHRLQVLIPLDLAPVWMDSVEIGEALYNLIENATKYAPQQTEILVEVRSEGSNVSVIVADRGPGIPPSALPHLFDPFYRAIDRANQPRPGGLGLGLAVVKGLAEAHGGGVTAENRAGGGARFTLTLPISDAGAGAPPAPEISAA